MEIAIDIEEIVNEVIDSNEFGRLVDDAVEEAVSDAIGRIDIDDLDDFERRVEEIVNEILVDDHRVDAPVDTALTDRVAALEQRVGTLISALDAASNLLRVLIMMDGEV